MEYTYAALILSASGEELNERNLTAVLEAAGCDVVESRAKALVAGFEGVDVDETRLAHEAEARSPADRLAERDSTQSETRGSGAAEGDSSHAGDGTAGEGRGR